MASERVREVRELMALLEENHMTRMGALRTAVECVYGLAEQYYRRNFEQCGVSREAQSNQEWGEVKG